MKAMGAKDYLESMRSIRASISRTIERIRFYEDQLEIQGIEIRDGRPVRTTEDRLSALTINLLEQRGILEGILTDYIEQEGEFVYVVEQLANPAQQRAITCRYLEGKSVEETARIMDYSPSGVRYCCKTAIAALDKGGLLVKSVANYRELRGRS